ncbi:MAG: hypothetical protein NTY86_19690 [Deltaproteobacteria bacterium]|nr:hypothetical protein [Deltaproteobacteria bacterium]
MNEAREYPAFLPQYTRSVGPTPKQSSFATDRGDIGKTSFHFGQFRKRIGGRIRSMSARNTSIFLFSSSMIYLLWMKAFFSGCALLRHPDSFMVIVGDIQV